MGTFLSAGLYEDEDKAARILLETVEWDGQWAKDVEKRAVSLIKAARASRRPPGQLEAFMQSYSLDTDEGLALMCLAEALLRIPDSATASALIRDKVMAANWLAGKRSMQDWIVKAAGLGLLVTSKTLDSAVSRLGEPIIRQAMVSAMSMVGRQFVIGNDIDAAMRAARKFEAKGYRLSYDMLGEGARTAAAAEGYFEHYKKALEALADKAQREAEEAEKSEEQEAKGKEESTKSPPVPDGISIKLSALHPRFEEAQGQYCIPALVESLAELASIAAQHNISLTVDAEETERMGVTLAVFNQVFESDVTNNWDGLGLVVQAYQKRAVALCDYLSDRARAQKKRLQVRLVKGAYWDREIKRAQVLGLEEYPVYTRKSTTDMSYLLCAQRLLKSRDVIYPMFGTHNAHSVAAVLEMAAKEGAGDFEFQRLFGMGEALYDAVLNKDLAPVTIYAPVGEQADLLAYLVRRLLENGANNSFVSKILDKNIRPKELAADPVAMTQSHLEEDGEGVRHPKIPLPRDIYRSEDVPRINAMGVDLDERVASKKLLWSMKRFDEPYQAMPLIGGKPYQNGVPANARNPADFTDNLGRCWFADKGLVGKAVRVAGEAFPAWRDRPIEERAMALERYADLLEDNHKELMALIVREGGRTVPDALSELREAVDFCRYYANRARLDFADTPMSAPTGEVNLLRMQGRGIFACISPWNFPLAIFTGQIAAALVAGNTVIAKPAEQTPLVAAMAVRLMHEAGIPPGAVNLLIGEGDIGAALCAHPKIAGVAFTGSVATAKEINKTLAVKPGAITPLIAETGGQNAMIVDSSALPEQVVDDVILSAFGSAGQRCSALRVLYLQEDIADTITEMLRGKLAELHMGNPMDLSTDIGPVIDEEALQTLTEHKASLAGFGKFIGAMATDADLEQQGTFFAPCIYEIPDIHALHKEVFGPILHIVRYKASEIDEVISDINAAGYGLTCGVHSRIETFQQKIAAGIDAGNVYVNRSMIGAVVGVQPFGGMGLSGTGPKAGGPHYLQRFATEKVISINTTAAGGNTALVTLEE